MRAPSDAQCSQKPVSFLRSIHFFGARWHAYLTGILEAADNEMVSCFANLSIPGAAGTGRGTSLALDCLLTE